MLVRICLLVCATILLASANPVPQDTVQGLISENDQLLESNITTEIPESESEAVESDSGTEEPSNINNDGEGTGDQSEAGNGNENELKSNPGVDASSSDDNKEENESTNLENDESDKGLGPVTVTDEPSSKSKPFGEDDDESKSEIDTTDSSYDNDSENESDPDDNKSDKEDKSDDSSENDETGFDSESNDSDNTSDENPEIDNTLSIVQSNGVILRVYTFSTDDEEVTCQEIKKEDTVLENRCFIAPLLFTHLQGAHVSVFNKFINGEDFICQEIISYVRGPIQVLCVSNDRFFFRESTVLHPGSSYFGQVDINLPLY